MLSHRAGTEAKKINGRNEQIIDDPTYIHPLLHFQAYIHVRLQTLPDPSRVNLYPPELLPQIYLPHQPRPHDLEQMPLNPTNTRRRLQILHDFQVLQGQVCMPWVPDEDLCVGVVLGGVEREFDASEQRRVV